MTEAVRRRVGVKWSGETNACEDNVDVDLIWASASEVKLVNRWATQD